MAGAKKYKMSKESRKALTRFESAMNRWHHSADEEDNGIKASKNLRRAKDKLERRILSLERRLRKLTGSAQ